MNYNLGGNNNNNQEAEKDFGKTVEGDQHVLWYRCWNSHFDGNNNFRAFKDGIWVFSARV